MTLGVHEWVCYVPVLVDVIKNEDDDFLFKFIVPEGQDPEMDAILVTHWSSEMTICNKCKEPLEDVFGEPCRVTDN